jgi:hypothetical protein
LTEAIEQRVARAEEKITTLFTCAERIKNRQEAHETKDGEVVDRIMDRLDNMQSAYANRLPIWAVLLIATLTAGVGWLAR